MHPPGKLNSLQKYEQILQQEQNRRSVFLLKFWCKLLKKVNILQVGDRTPRWKNTYKPDNCKVLLRNRLGLLVSLNKKLIRDGFPHLPASSTVDSPAVYSLFNIMLEASHQVFTSLSSGSLLEVSQTAPKYRIFNTSYDLRVHRFKVDTELFRGLQPAWNLPPQITICINFF